MEPPADRWWIGGTRMPLVAGRQWQQASQPEPLAIANEMMRPTRRFFQFSLRSLLIVMICLGFLLGINKQRADRQSRAVSMIKKHGGSVGYAGTGPFIGEPGGWGFDEQPQRYPAWLIDAVGVDHFATVEGVSFSSDDRTFLRYRRSMKMPPGSKMQPGYPDPPEDQMIRVPDDVFAALGSLHGVRAIYLAETDVDDGDLIALERLSNLNYVALGNKVTEQGVDRLQRALPNATIDY